MFNRSALWLDAGIHGLKDPRFCLMEHVSVLLDEAKSFAPSGISPVLASIAGNVNDRLDHEPRQALVEFIPEFLELTQEPPRREVDELLALWVLSEGLPSLPPSAFDECAAALEDVWRWYDDRTRNTQDDWRHVSIAASAHSTAWSRLNQHGLLPEAVTPLQFVMWRHWLFALLDFGDAVAEETDLRCSVRSIARHFLLGDLHKWLGDAIAQYRRIAITAGEADPQRLNSAVAC